MGIEQGSYWELMGQKGRRLIDACMDQVYQIGPWRWYCRCVCVCGITSHCEALVMLALLVWEPLYRWRGVDGLLNTGYGRTLNSIHLNR